MAIHSAKLQKIISDSTVKKKKRKRTPNINFNKKKKKSRHVNQLPEVYDMVKTNLKKL